MSKYLVILHLKEPSGDGERTEASFEVIVDEITEEKIIALKEKVLTDYQKVMEDKNLYREYTKVITQQVVELR